MNRCLPSFVLAAGVASCALAGSTSTTLSVSQNPVNLGQTVTLTATVSPAGATGKCTFYDGSVILGISTLTGGSATFTTNQLGSGLQSLTVRYDGDSSNTGSLSAASVLTVQSKPALNFLALPSLNANYSANYGATADFNGDGYADLAVYSFGAIQIYLGRGDGTFTAGANIPLVNVEPQALVVADFNGDGKLDLALAVAGPSGVDILLGNGDGTFQTPVSITFAFYSVTGLQVADFNSDGIADLLIPIQDEGVLIALGNGDGTFAPAALVPTTYYDQGVIAGDFNGDGKIDFIVPGAGSYSFYPGNGDGSFGAASTYASPILGSNPIAADLNADGKLDLIWSTGLSLQSVLGNGDGTFQPISTASIAGNGLAVADVNGDGKLDALTTTEIAYGNGDGTFQSGFVFFPQANPQYLAFVNVADLNNNGQVDIIAGGVSVYLGTIVPTVTLVPSATSITIGQTLGLSASVSPATATGTITFLDTGKLPGTVALASGVATLSEPATATGLHLLSVTYSGDSLTQPGVSPLVSVNFTGAPSTITLGASSSTLTYGDSVTLTATVSPSAATGSVTFFDNGGPLSGGMVSGGQAALTTATLSTGSHSLTAQYDGGTAYNYSTSAPVSVVVTSQAGGALSSGPQLTDAGYAALIAGADLNGDGLTDLVAANYNNTVSVFLSTGPGMFASPVNYNLNAAPLALSINDVNGDGFGDLLVPTVSGLNVLLGNGDGTFRAGPTNSYVFPVSVYSLEPNPYPWALADFNSDGRIDIASLNQSTNSVSLLFGNGDGSFQEPVSFPVTGESEGISTADFNGDGRPDLLVTSTVLIDSPQQSGEFLVFLGNGDGTFASPVTTPCNLAVSPSELAVGDFNEDGFPDVAAVYPSYTLSIYLGKGDGSFTAGATYPDGPEGPLYVADINGDGHLDLLSLTNGPFLYYGKGDGTFSPGYFAETSYFSSSWLALGDFDKTGRVSIAGISGGGIGIQYDVRPSNMLLQTTPNPTAGQPITITATITPSNATGTVTFSDGQVTLGSSSVINGSASITTSALQANYQELSASYSGDSITSPSSGYYELFATGEPVSVSLSPTTAQQTLGQPVTFTATVSPSAATGSVTFFDGLTNIGGAPIVGGQASFTTSLLPFGTNKVKAVYGGNSTYGDGAGSPLAAVTVKANPGGAFRYTPLPTYPSGTPLAVGDFNGDGKPDLLIQEQPYGAYSNLTGAILLGNGDGTFQAGTSWDLGPEYVPGLLTPQTFAVGDLNGDGKLDFAAPYGGYATAIYFGNGNGTFSEPSLYYFGTSYGIVTADFNNDGLPDLATIDNVNGVGILLGIGGGNFDYWENLPSGLTSYSVTSLAVGDFNGDGKPDLAISGYAANSISIFLGNGDGTFQAPLNANTGAIPGEVVVGDFNGDGIQDLAVLTGSPSNNFVVLLGNGDGSFQAPVSYVGAGGATQIGFGDFNGDGVADMVTSGPANEAISYGNGNGTFQSPISFTPSTASAIVADFNGDGIADLPGELGALPASVALISSSTTATIDQTITLTATVTPITATGSVSFSDAGTVLGNAPVVNGVATLTVRLPAGDLQHVTAKYLGNSTYDNSSSLAVTETVSTGAGGTFSNAVNYPAGISPANIVAGDFNHDGALDLAVASKTNASLTVLLGAGDGTFSAPDVITLPGVAEGLVAADLSGGGTPSVIAGLTNNQTVALLYQNGSIQQTISPGITFYGVAAAGDLNGDGNTDLLTDEGIYWGNGNGAFTNDQGNLYASPFGIADFNGDNLPDIIVDETGVCLGNGFGGFNCLNSNVLGADALGIGDFNGDGKPDIAYTLPDQSGLPLHIALGNGDGTFQTPNLYQTAAVLTSITAGDFNGDGKMDLAMLDVNGSAGIMLGNGDGTFQPEIFYLTGTQAQSLVLGDFNGDGRLDMAVANSASNNISILLGAAVTGCSIAVSPTSFAFDAGGGAATVIVTASGSQCPWGAVLSQTYNTFGDTSQATSGTGSGSFTFTVPQNYTGAPAAATISVAGNSIPVSVDETKQVFADVPLGVYYFDAVNLLYGRGITNGCSTTDYCPTDDITRAEMAIFIVRSVLGLGSFTYSTTPYFSDVPAGAFGFEYIQKLYELGITNGCGVGLFCPDDNVTRAQMAVFIIRARYGAATVVDYPATPYFTDVPSGSFAFNDIQRMKEDNITSGCETTQYCPDDPVIRGDMAIFVMRGAFNQLLPSTEPVLSEFYPAFLTNGTSSSFEVTGVNTNFVAGTTVVNAVAGITVDSVSVTGPTTLTVQLTGSATTTPQPVSIWVTTGQQEAVFPNALTVQ
jgi:uncharacterized protein YjdB